MALQSFTIYGPEATIPPNPYAKDKETGSEENWEPIRIPGSLNKPLHFVLAAQEYDEYGRPRIVSAESRSNDSSSSTGNASAIGNWYTSLPRAATAHTITKAPLRSPPTTNLPHIQHNPVVNAKPDWFSSKPSSSGASTPSDTLADMIRRDPPNPNQPHKPPVWLALGPDNKGFEMLHKSGWREGEGLGATASRKFSQKPKEEIKWSTLGGELPRLTWTATTGDIPLTEKNDASESSSSGDEDEDEMFNPEIPEQPSISTATSHTQPILTPIPVALKNDRKGIGAPHKRRMVSHSTLEMQQHVRDGVALKRNIDQAKRKAKFGKGKKAFERMHKRQMESKLRLMEYMKS